MVLDTQVSKKKQPGDFGYVSYVRHKSLRIAFVILLCAFAIFFVGTTYFEAFESSFIVVSMILFIPSAQNLAKYFSFRVYKNLELSALTELSDCAEGNITLGGIAVIHSRKTVFYSCVVITSHGVAALSQHKTVDSLKHLEDLLHPRGYLVPIQVFNDSKKLMEYIKSNRDKTINEERMEAIKQELLSKSH